MTSQELDQLRREKWRTHGTPVATLEEARAFVDSVGICLLYPEKPALLLPTLVGAVAGEDRDLPTARQAFADERAGRAVEFLHRLVQQRAAFESDLFAGNPLLLSPNVFPYFYALAREGKTGLMKRPELSQLAQLAWKVFERKGRVTPQQLRESLGAELSSAALERALHELWARLRVVPEERGGEERWATLERWAPEVVNQAQGLSVPVALSAVVSQYLEGVVAAEQRDVEEFFTRFLPRSRVHDCIQALLAAREFSFIYVGERTLIQVTPERTPDPRRAAKPQPRERKLATPGRRRS